MRKLIYLFLSFLALAFVFIKPSYAVYDPNAKHSKWFTDSIVADPTVKSNVEIKAQRNYPVSTIGADGKPIIQQKVQKSVIKLAPKAANVGKSLIKRAPAIAITQAVVALLGKGVDWLMDAENNRVKYKDPTASGGSDGLGYGQYIWQSSAGAKKKYSTPEAACDYLAIVNNGAGIPGYSFSHLDGNYCYYNDKAWSSVQRLPNPNYDPNAPTSDDWQYIPIDQVAQKIIDQANSATASTGSNTGSDGGAALQVMSDAALDMVEAGLLDAQLEAAAESKIFNEGETDPTDPNAPNPDPDAPTDPNAPNPDAKPFELPPFCSWAVKVCDFIDWVQTEPPEPPENGDIEVSIPDPVMHESILERLYISMPAQCPADPILEFMGAKIPFPMSVFCQFAVMMKPLILLFAYIKGLSIIGNGLS